MTPEMLAIAKEWCELVGWKECDSPAHQKHNEPSVVIPGHKPSKNRLCTPYAWLLSGNGCMAVKSEMAKRNMVVETCVGIEIVCCIHVKSGVDDWGKTDDVYAPTEPHAVLVAAVAAMKGKHA